LRHHPNLFSNKLLFVEKNYPKFLGNNKTPNEPNTLIGSFSICSLSTSRFAQKIVLKDESSCPKVVDSAIEQISTAKLDMKKNQSEYAARSAFYYYLEKFRFLVDKYTVIC